jgi:hypothetical protein
MRIMSPECRLSFLSSCFRTHVPFSRQYWKDNNIYHIMSFFTVTEERDVINFREMDKPQLQRGKRQTCSRCMSLKRDRKGED